MYAVSSRHALIPDPASIADAETVLEIVLHVPDKIALLSPHALL